MMSGVHMGAAVKGAPITHADAKMNAVQYYQVCMASTRQSGRLYFARGALILPFPKRPRLEIL